MEFLILKVHAKIPVRRHSHPTAVRTVELIRRDLEVLALVNHEVNFRLNDDSKLSHDGRDRSLIMTVPKVRN